MILNEVKAVAKNSLNDCSIDSSTFHLRHLKSHMEKKLKDVAAANGLDQETIKCGIPDRTGKVAMIAASMGGSSGGVPTISNRKLLTKIEC